MRRLGSQEASSTTELVLLMPVALMVVMLLVQAGLYFHAGQVAEAAAQEALEVAQAERGDAAQGTAAAEAFLAEAGGVRDPTVAVDREADRVRVEVHATAPNVLPGAVWRVSATVAGGVERFVAEPDR